MKKGFDMLNQKEKQALLSLARQAIANELGLPTSAVDVPAEFSETPQGLFVTLHLGGELRGCIGNMELKKPIHRAVAELARESAFGDPRFLPLSKEEYPRVALEISILSPLHRVTSPDDIQPHVHGVWIKFGNRSGVFLPQVWEHLPRKNDFLDVLCTEKAGLSKGFWRDPRAELFVFTVDIIEEKTS